MFQTEFIRPRQPPGAAQPSSTTRRCVSWRPVKAAWHLHRNSGTWTRKPPRTAPHSLQAKCSPSFLMTWYRQPQHSGSRSQCGMRGRGIEILSRADGIRCMQLHTGFDAPTNGIWCMANGLWLQLATGCGQ